MMSQSLGAIPLSVDIYFPPLVLLPGSLFYSPQTLRLSFATRSQDEGIALFAVILGLRGFSLLGNNFLLVPFESAYLREFF